MTVAFLWWVWLIVRILCIIAGLFTLLVIAAYFRENSGRRKGLR